MSFVPVDSGVEALRNVLGGRRPAVAGHDTWTVSGLETVVPETVLLCVQRSGAVDVLRARGVDVFCLSEHVPPAEVSGRSTVDLLSHPAAQDFCRRLGPLLVTAFKPTERLAAAVAAVGSTLVAGSPAVARAFENKLAFTETARRLGLRTPDFRQVDVTAATTFEELSPDGVGLVLQGARGNAGQRTWLARDQHDLDRALAAEAPGRMRIAPYLRGMPFTATGLAGPAAGEALVGWIEPCRQVTGVPWLTPIQLGSCGNAWPEHRLDAHRDAARRAVEAIALELSDAGYKGPFGVDFVLDTDGPRVIETNPRMVASLSLATQLEAFTGAAPLLLLNLLQALDGGSHGIPAGSEPDLPGASQLIVHDITSRSDTASGQVFHPHFPRSGVYRLRPGSAPSYLREGAWWKDLAAPDEALLMVRDPGEPVSAGREFARILLPTNRAEHTPGVHEAVRLLRGD